MEGKQVGIVLMGLRGSGKSSVGYALAQHINQPFVELDMQTLQQLGTDTVTQAWETVGESGFRSAETQALCEVLDQAGTAVIALGGGTPTAPGAAQQLRDARDTGKIVLIYLRVTPRLLRERLSKLREDDRPTLTGKGRLNEIDTIFELRDSLYTELATYTVNVGSMDIEERVMRIAALPMPVGSERTEEP